LLYRAREHMWRAKFRLSALGDVFPSSLRFVAHKPVLTLADATVRLAISRGLGIESLGVFARSLFIWDLSFRVVSVVLKLAYFPAMSRIQADVIRMGKGLERALALTALFLLPGGVFVALHAEGVIGLLLGSQWGAAILPFAFLSLALYPELGASVLATFFNSTGRPLSMMPFYVMRLSLFVSSAAVLAPVGLPELVAGLAVSSLICFLAALVTAARRVNLSGRTLCRIHFPAIVTTGLVVGVNELAVALVSEWLPSAQLFVSVAIVGLAVALAIIVQPRLFLGEVGCELLARMASSLRRKLGPKNE
ncbi:MAG: oligosaccharide flippase family protein, partial [Alphaproteobacteria bacterium]|nr:oligosaccharide flippase family protein [Alphaproteobacteria bacterium]